MAYFKAFVWSDEGSHEKWRWSICRPSWTWHLLIKMQQNLTDLPQLVNGRRYPRHVQLRFQTLIQSYTEPKQTLTPTTQADWVCCRLRTNCDEVGRNRPASYQSNPCKHDFRPPPQCNWYPHSSGLLRTVGWRLVTYQSHLQESSKGSSTLEDGSDRLSRNVGNYHSTVRNIPEEGSQTPVVQPKTNHSTACAIPNL